MNTRGFVRGAAALASTVVLGTAGTVVASAATTASPSASASAAASGNLAALKARCNAAVQMRLGTLGADLSFVRQTGALSSSDRAALESQISADQSGLTSLDATIQADTTYKQARQDCSQIVLGYRVYVLEDPKIHEVIAADGIAKVDAMYETLIPELESDIDNSSQSQSVKEQASDYLNDLRNKVRASEVSVSGVSASVINLQPSGYPGNKVVLTSARQNIETSHDDLSGARGDVNQILRLLGQ